jgi:1-aminocyclopropane-1-carboxylate deaminase/D-cysteine desulfhydrase-like pyridoxal-dependent ACC family enzyme
VAVTPAPSSAARIPADAAPADLAARGRRPYLIPRGGATGLDPVYTAKALAPRGRDVVFWHTGGVLDTVAAAEEQP